MLLKDLKINLPKNWKEISRSAQEDSFYLKFYHINPAAHLDPKLFQDQIFSSPNSNVSKVRLAIPVASKAPLKDFREGMKGAIDSGFMPFKGATQKIDNLCKKMAMGYYPEDGDFSGDILITRHPNEEIARQSFKNIALLPTQRFNAPIPGGVQIPGAPENMTFAELFETDIYEKYMPGHLEKMKEHMPVEQKAMAEEQIKKLKELMSKEQMEKIRAEIEKAQKQLQEEKKANLGKSGAEYKETKYLGYDAICLESKNPTPPPNPIKSKNPSDVGGGFDDRYDPLPKISKPYKDRIINYQALLIKNFIITGNLLWQIDSLPPGDTPCYSLTKSKKKISTYREGGMTFEDITITPIVSNYKKEGYLYKEEVEEIFKKILAELER